MVHEVHLAPEIKGAVLDRGTSQNQLISTAQLHDHLADDRGWVFDGLAFVQDHIMEVQLTKHIDV